jgi:Antitoxin of toxin-antitoxin, RelE / RelB, TA system
MATHTAPLTTGFTEAKSQLSTLMDEVVHRHRPKVIDRHKGRESMLALQTDDAAEIFLSAAVTPLEVAHEEDEVVVTATALSLIGDGPDLSSALEMLADEIEDFACAYFDRFDYHRHTPDRALAPFLLRLLLTSRDQRPALLLEPLKRGEMDAVAGGHHARRADAAAA